MAIVESEAAVLVDAIGGCSDHDLARVTRCGSWDVHDVLGHVLLCLERAATMVERPTALELIDPDRHSYYRSPARSDPDRDRVRQLRTAEASRRFVDAAGAAGEITAAVGRIRDGSDRLGPDIAVTAHWGPTMRLEDYLATRVVELAVHGIDIADALDRPHWTTPAALALIADTLRALAPRDLPAEWSTRDVVLLGTGRRGPTEEEVAQARGEVVPPLIS